MLKPNRCVCQLPQLAWEISSIPCRFYSHAANNRKIALMFHAVFILPSTSVLCSGSRAFILRITPIWFTAYMCTYVAKIAEYTNMLDFNLSRMPVSYVTISWQAWKHDKCDCSYITRPVSDSVWHILFIFFSLPDMGSSRSDDLSVLSTLFFVCTSQA